LAITAAKGTDASATLESSGVGRHREDALRVCALIQSFRPTVGGAELQLERLLPHLEARGVDVTVLTRGVRGMPRRERVGDAEIRRGVIGGRSPAASAAYTLSAVAHIAVHRDRYDLVHAHGALSEGTIALGAERLGMPALVKVLLAGNDGDFEVLAGRLAGRWRTRSLVRRAWFAATSAAVRAQLERLGVPPSRIFAIPNGVDVDVYRPPSPDERLQLRFRLGLAADAPLALFIGRLVPRKRVATAIRAVGQTEAEIRLVVVGEGPERSNLERIAHEHGLAERVSFTGAVPNVADYLRAADFFVLPSRSEGLSNALLEAMACGLACLAPPVSGVDELFAGGRGIVVASEEAEAWRRVLERLAADPEQSKRLGARARELVCADFTLERTADRLVAAYRTMLSRRSS
jgi:glycosyltransferase involved in cell wall biosynthesis